MNIKRTLLVLLAMAITIVVPVVAFAARSQTGAAERTLARWLAMDKDGDGKISADEAQGQLKSNFGRIDTNNDGFLDRSELNALSQRLARGRSRRQSNRSQAVRLPAGARLERDVVYSQVGDRKLLLDLCLPAKGPEPSPVIVWVHGGGWRGGSKNAGSRARGMLDRGYAVVDVGYRLSGEAIFPAQIEDCKAAVRWVRANATKYGFDPDRIGAWGSSAGGHLVALMGTAGDVKEFDTETHARYSSRVQAVCDWFGPTDFLQMDRHMIEGSRLVHDEPGSPESLLVGGPIQKEPYKSLAAKADPIAYVTEDDPPFLIMHGDKDMLVPLHQSELLLDALKKAGVSASLYVVKGGGHGLRGGEESQEELFEMVAGFFDKHLKKPKPAVAPANRRGARNKPKLRPPTYGDVKYGPHKQNVIDFYKAESDVPIFMSYGMKPDDPVPTEASRAQGWKVHHVMFGIKLKEKMDELGLEADLKHPGAKTVYRSTADFLIRKLGANNS